MTFLPMMAVVVATLSPAIALAQTQTQAVMQVSVTVVPHCRISVDEAPGGRGPAVTASCGISSLRALRVTTSRGETIQPVSSRRVRAGGDATFIIPQTSRDAGRTIVVTLE